VNGLHRGAVKLAAILVPALLLIGGLRVFGSGLRAAVRHVTTPRTIVDPDSGHEWIMPRDYRHEREVKDFVPRFLSWVSDERAGPFRLTHNRLPKLRFHLYDQAPPGAGPTHAGGAFSAADRAVLVDLAGDPAAAEVKTALAHGLAHALLHYHAPDAQWSPWLVEGIAQYYEAHEPGTIAWRPLRIRDISKDVKPGFLESLLKMEALPADRLHAHASYALVCYLLHGNETLRRRLGEYYAKEMEPGRAARAAFEAAFGPLAEFEAAWIDWLASPRLPH
jgi:hypothetical protein